ncbi:COG0748: Putative heme iron utilization protein [Richelia intracellularis HM01]|uniref:HugZ family pyridoxamine 5'-phosphate oxidase n=1 Tax=Richelia intracellularis TaxID=1164990 RepID=UPI0002B58AE8|nr:pyridoxamine 5'-phosphate oxidase family protein [Richelia intracellularis]CCH66000.1 COG0748: Putative heme iron utilization protein [Richelia intracellularis HM01]
MNQLEITQLEYEKFPDKFVSLFIATVSKEGLPHASYIPFVMDEAKNTYIFVSGLSAHTHDLYHLPKASILFAEEDSQTAHIFARRRLVFECNAVLILRDTQEWFQITGDFEQRFGEIIRKIISLPDFRIFKLIPYTGKFITGFGAAYRICGDNLRQLIHIDPTKDN